MEGSYINNYYMYLRIYIAKYYFKLIRYPYHTLALEICILAR